MRNNSRNHQHEYAMRKEKIKRYECKLNHDEANQLDEQLAKKDLKFTSWVRQKIKKGDDEENQVTT